MRLLDAFEPWVAREWGARDADWLRRSLKACHRYKGAVSAGYAVWWEHTPEGRDWWVQILVDNNTDDLLDVAIRGSMWADGVLPRYRDPYGPDTHWGREADQYTWGASSYDETYSPPRQRIRMFVAIGPSYKVHLNPEGGFFDIRPEVYVSLLRESDEGDDAGEAGCALPVPRLN